MELLNRTILPKKERGDGLTAAEINSMNDTINLLVSYVNKYLNKFCDINIEIDDNTKTFTLEAAIKAVPTNRRSLGMTIRFLKDEDNLYHNFVYLGKSLSEESWLDVENWFLDEYIIDGGEW